MRKLVDIFKFKQRLIGTCIAYATINGQYDIDLPPIVFVLGIESVELQYYNGVFHLTQISNENNVVTFADNDEMLIAVRKFMSNAKMDI